MTKLFMLDNLDSFTYNLVDEFQCLGFDPTIYRNTLSADFIFNKMLAYQAEQNSKKNQETIMLVLSPGPGEPKNAGCLMALIEKCAGRFPILAICLGHQALIEHYGGRVDRADEIVHGKASPINHNESGAFAGIHNPLPVARYHSLIGTHVPKQLEVTAHYNGMPMAIEHKKDAVLGFQFHPESILTTFGSHLLAQSIEHLLSLFDKNEHENEHKFEHNSKHATKDKPSANNNQSDED